MNALRANSGNVVRHLIRSAPRPARAFTIDHSSPIISSSLSSTSDHIRHYFKDRENSYVRKCPPNFGMLFVPQAEAYVVQRFGKFKKLLPPGLNFLWPIIEEVSYVHSLKEEVIRIPKQEAITKDNVQIEISSVLYVKIVDAYQASYGADRPIELAIQHAQSVMRSVVGKMSFDQTLEGRTDINKVILDALTNSSADWGLKCIRYEILDIEPPQSMKLSMQKVADKEREKRADILISEGVRQTTINQADGEKCQAILAAEARKKSLALLGEGEAHAIQVKADANAYAIKAAAAATAEGFALLSKRLEEEGGKEAAALKIAEQYVEAFAKIAKEGTTVLLPSATSDPANLIAQALTITKRLSQQPSKVIDQV